MQSNPTLAAGDVKVAIDDGAPANLATLPVVDADFTKRVKVSLSAAEMNGDNISIIFSDAAGDEWCDLIINIQTAVNQIDDLQTGLADIPTVAEFEARTLPSADYTIVSDLGTVQSGDSYAIVNGDHGLVSIQDDVDAILVDTDELQTDWADSGRLDMLLDAILLDTGTTLDGKIDVIDTNTFNLVTALITAFAPSSLAADIAVIYGSVDDIVNDLTQIAGPGFNQANDSLSILSDKLDALVADILDGVVEGTYTFQDCMKIILAYMASKATGGGTPEVKFRDTADTKDRIVMAVDGNGNRSAITVDVT